MDQALHIPRQKLSGHPLAVRLFLPALLVVIAMVQVWIVTAGGAGWPQYSTGYSRLATAFLHGQTSLLIQPSPQLLALPDPYNPLVNRPYALHDAILFNGKYYIYFGPVPGLFVAAACRVIGKTDPAFGDGFLVLPLMFATTVLAAILITQVRKILFPDQPVWTVGIFVLSLGLGTPVLYTLARSAIYEAAIGAGQFFLLAGILAAWFGLIGPRARTGPMLTAGICLGLSVGSRVSLAPAVTAITLLAVWRARRLETSGARWSAPAAGLLIPLITAAALLAWYNYARFHSISEFGMRYQLAGRNQHAKPLSEFSSPRYVVFNLYRYVLNPPSWQRTFPFVTAPSGMTRFAENFALPTSFGYESVVGIAWAQPLLLLAPVAAAAPWWRRFSAVAAALPDRGLAVWLALTLAFAVVLGFAPALSIEGSTMRYMLDMIPACTVLAAVGMWWLMAGVGQRSGRWIAAALTCVALGQSLMGMLLGLSGYYQHFLIFNPTLYHAMASWFAGIGL